MPLLRWLLVVSVLTTCVATPAAEPGVNDKLLQPLQWRSIGPFRGGRVLTVSGVPGDPNRFYFGAVDGGVWETEDAGRTWRPIFDSAPVGSVGALAVAPSDPSVIYVGTGEADMRSDIAQGAGLYRSADAGRSWRPLGLADSQQIGRIWVDPASPDIVLVAILGHPYGANDTRGVFRSVDGGKSFQRTLFKDPDTGAIDIAAAPGQSKVVYASLWQTRRPPWNVYPPSSGPGGGLYKSMDGGQSWIKLTGHGLPNMPGRIGIAVSPSKSERVYALVDAAEGGLYRSDDAGATWALISSDSRIWNRGWYFGGVTVDPANPDTVYICNTAMYRSSDGGRTFGPIKGAPGGDDYHQLWIDPGDSRRQILGVDQGAVVTVNGGVTWSSWFNQPTGQFYHVVTDNRFPYWVYGAQQDSGAAGIPSRTYNIDAINLTQFRETAAGGESDNLAPDPDDPEILFGGRVDRLDLRTGQTQSVDPTLAFPGLYRATWTLPLVFSTIGRHALYFGNQRIFRTTDRGGHWDAISPDLTRESPEVPASLDPTTATDYEFAGPRRGVVYAIGPSPLDDRLIWAGTDDGLVWRSPDGGGHWDNVTPAALGAWAKVGVVEPSHFDRNTAYIAVDRHRLDDPQPYIYRTHDGGRSWTLISDGIADAPFLNTVNVVREDPVHGGLLYAGTERGVYVSFDDGAHWQPLQRNLPRTSVRDIQVHGDDLVIATHGRGFWIMDDIALVRSLADDQRAGVRLFAPAIAVRARPSGFTGSPMPLDEARGANPPSGAYIDYALDGTLGGVVTLTITDAHGGLVRRFSSQDHQPMPDLAKSVIAPEWIESPQPLANGAGGHRLVWDLRYPAARGLTSEDSEVEREGVWAPPGEYWIELTAGGQTVRQRLTVVPDPRVKLPAQAYTQQFALEREIEGARVRSAAALAEAESIHREIAERMKNATAQALGALSTTDQQLLAVCDLAPAKTLPDRMGAPPATTTGLRYLDVTLRALDRAVGRADASPSPDAKRGFALQKSTLDATLADWSRFKAVDLERLNALLRSAGMSAIVP